LFTTTQPGQVLQSLASGIGSVPRVLLPDTADGTTEPPLVNPASAEMPPPEDRPVRVQLLGEIARGGMGVVLKGRDPDLGRDLAVKVLLETHRQKPDLVRRFVEEAQIGGQLQHPGVVPVYELGTFGDRRPYFTMKLVKGQTLSELLAERASPVDELPRFLAIFEQVCQTMAYAHARDVVHRDLKPSNVMVGSFGEVQVMDWGLAKVLPRGGVVDDAAAGRVEVNKTVIATARFGSDSDLSQAGSVMGTPAYMAPEQARGEIDQIDERADVFALGSILCEILTGQPAFVGRSAGEIQRKAALGDLAEAVTALASSGADVDLITLARDCLARESEDRPRHAGAVAERITAYRADVQEKLRASEIARATEEARAEEEVKRRVLADELAREAQARAEESRRTAEVAEARAKAERRARRLTGALAVSVLGLVVVGGGGYAWFQRQRAERQSRVDLALREAEVLHDEAERAGDDLARWGKAREAAHAVERLLADASDQATRQRVAVLVQSVTAEAQTAEADQKLLEKLIDIRSAKEDDPDGSATDAAYAAAFREAGIDVAALPPAEVGARIKSRPTAVALALATTLDAWAAVRRNNRRDPSGAVRQSQAAGAADPDPWRVGLREALDAPDKQKRLDALRELARSAKFDELPPVSLHLLGSALRDAGDPKAAESVLRPAQRRHPGDVWLNHSLAQCLERLARREDAIRYYTAARSIRPEVAHELAHALREKGESDEAVAVFQDLTKLRPGNGRHSLCLGITLQERGRTSEARVALEAAIAVFREAIRQKPEDDVAHDHLGSALNNLGKRDEAIAEYQEAIRLRPDNAYTRDNLGLALLFQGKYDQAIQEFRAAIQLQPDLANPHHNLGCILCDQKHDYSAAAAEFREAIRLQPDFASSHHSIGNVLRAQGKVDEAIAEEREAVRLKPDKALFHYNLGWDLQSQGKLEEAIAEYKEAIRLSPDYSDAIVRLYDLLKSQGKVDEAITTYKEAVRLRPDNGDYHSVLAWALVLFPGRPRHHYEEGLVHARKAVELAPNDGGFTNTLALAEYRVGHWAESIAASERSMALRNGSGPSDWFFLTMALWQKGEKDKARKWFDKAVAWTKEKDPKNSELRQFWTEAAELMGQPGPDAHGMGSTTAPAVEKPH
jgi:serine/threonine-protein kinase